jgi:DNA helicase-2/ATP-dependent DNA helicase PcrA
LAIKLDTVAVRELAAEIEWRKYSLRSLEQYSQATRPKVTGLSLEQNLAIQEAYEAAKIKAQRLDWEDVLILTLGLLRAEPLALSHVQQRYRFFTVDEYQDISPLQHELLDLWLGDHNDLCVVGDPNQTIYSFTGASSEYLYNFASRYNDANVFELTQNYRSSKQIVTAANRVVSDSHMISPLRAIGELGNPVQALSFATLQDEVKAVANEIKYQLDAGVKASEIAVLYRVNGQSESIEAALSALGIEYQLRGGERFFNRPEIQRAMTAIRAEAVSAARPDKSTFELVSDICRSIGWTQREPDHAGPERERWDSLNALLMMVDELPEGASIADFATELEERKRSQHEPLKASVTLSTIHAAKGLEWASVFVVGLTEGYLPIVYASKPEEIAEEKRLFYVAITRAKRNLWLSWAKSDGRPREASRFLSLLA